MTQTERYTVRDALWQALADDDRSMAWLARRAGCTEQKMRALKSGHNRTLDGALAARIAAVIGRPTGDIFLPIVATSVANNATSREDNAA